MAAKKLDFSLLEARGISVLQQRVLHASTQLEQAALMLKNAEDVAARELAGKLPEGVTVRQIRIDERTGEVFGPEA